MPNRPQQPLNLPTPMVNEGEECGTAPPRVISSSPVPATVQAEPPQFRPIVESPDTLGIGTMTTEVQRNLALINKFGMLNVFAAVILSAAGVGMTTLWVSNQSYVAQAITLQVETTKIAREDAKEAAKLHREDQMKFWQAQRDLSAAIRDQTRAAEETHATMKKAVELMGVHAASLDKILKSK